MEQEITLNKYASTLKDVKPHLDLAFESLNLDRIVLLVAYKVDRISYHSLIRIVNYIKDHDRIVEIKYTNEERI